MRQASIIAGTLLVATLCPFVLADKVSDNANDGRRDSSKWSERESSDARKTQANESGGKIRIDSKKGKGGAAAFVSTVVADWTDPFHVEFEHTFAPSKTKGSAQSATGGLALGFGTLDPATGYRDGVNVQAVRNGAGRSLQVTVRQGGVTVDSASASLDVGAHDFHVSFSGGPLVSMSVYQDGSATPILTVDGLETYLLGHEAQGMSIALFGGCTAKVKLESSFDNFLFSGDRQNDGNDAGYDDSDGSSDSDENDTYEDDHGGHGGGGDDGSGHH